MKINLISVKEDKYHAVVFLDEDEAFLMGALLRSPIAIRSSR